MKNIIKIIFLFAISIISLSYCYDSRCKYVTSAFDPLDCFNLKVSSSKIEKCCLIEYKNKTEDRRYRHCLELTLEEFLDIDNTIKEYEKNVEDISITSLECEKSSILSISEFIFIFVLLII